MTRDTSAIATSLAMGMIKATSFLYDIATLPVYTTLQQPWKAWRSTRRNIARQMNPSDPYSPMIRVHKIYDCPFSGIETIPELFDLMVRTHGHKACFGTREILDEEEEVQPDGKVFKKTVLGDYHWISYFEAELHVAHLTKSLLNLGVRPKETVLLLAETRVEWMLLAQACFRLSAPIVTLFATLGEEGIVHGICESGSSVLITSADLLPKIKTLLEQTPQVTHVIYMEGFRKPDLTGFPEKVKLFSYSQFYKLGEQMPEELPMEKPTKDDPALIMYTSGSTGKPKGVIFAHKHVIYNLDTVLNERIPFRSEDIYIAYLPLAHIFEFSVEFIALWLGVRIGYSSPFTLTDKSTAVKKGDKGDISVLQPSILIAVPVVLDRIKKGILEAVEAKGPFAKALFEFSLKYKSKWFRRGYNTPIVDRLVFNKIKRKVARNLKVIPTGGAPLSNDTWDFIRLALNVHVIMAYGQTETSGLGTFTNAHDRGLGYTGSPAKEVYIKLRDWKEGGYTVHDTPNPRGEIVIGGRSVVDGYFKNEELTREAFFEEDGIRWVATGDIGEWLPNGRLMIIDRKKDLVKLQYGEYVSLGKVEAELKTNPLVDNVCVIGNSYETYLIALIVPNRDHLTKLAQKLEIPKGHTFSEICQNPRVCNEVSRILRDHGKKCRLQRTEIPSKFKLCPEEWVPDTGLVTPAMKIRRKTIQQFYRDAIDELYGHGDASRSQIKCS